MNTPVARSGMGYTEVPKAHTSELSTALLDAIRQNAETTFGLIDGISEQVMRLEEALVGGRLYEPSEKSQPLDGPIRPGMIYNVIGFQNNQNSRLRDLVERLHAVTAALGN